MCACVRATSRQRQSVGRDSVRKCGSVVEGALTAEGSSAFPIRLAPRDNQCVPDRQGTDTAPKVAPEERALASDGAVVAQSAHRPRGVNLARALVDVGHGAAWTGTIELQQGRADPHLAPRVLLVR